jgi:hypothetical protein
MASAGAALPGPEALPVRQAGEAGLRFWQWSMAEGEHAGVQIETFELAVRRANGHGDAPGECVGP